MNDNYIRWLGMHFQDLSKVQLVEFTCTAPKYLESPESYHKYAFYDPSPEVQNGHWYIGGCGCQLIDLKEPFHLNSMGGCGISKVVGDWEDGLRVVLSQAMLTIDPQTLYTMVRSISPPPAQTYMGPYGSSDFLNKVVEFFDTKYSFPYDRTVTHFSKLRTK